MCLNPTYIKNPNIRSRTGKQFKKDTSSQFIPVPCGHCSECLATRSFGIQQRCELEELTGYPFMVYLSYNKSMVPTVVTSTGKTIRYADFKDVSNMFKRLRKSNAIGRPFRYLVTSERGSSKGRPHFHLLLYVQKFKQDSVYTIMQLEKVVHDAILSEWKRNVSLSTKFPEFVPLCTPIEYRRYGQWLGTYGCHYCVPGKDGTTHGSTKYVTKYFLKKDDHTDRLQKALKLNLPSYEYTKVWSKVRTQVRTSLNFGFGFLENYNARNFSRAMRLQILSKTPSFQYLKDSLSRSVDCQDSPKYYSLQDGRPLPLSRYFYHFENLYTLPIYEHFKDLNNDFGDFVQIDTRDTQYKLDKDSRQMKDIINSHKKTDITDLL